MLKIREDQKQKIEHIISQMTLEEKIGQLHQSGSSKEASIERNKALIKEGRIGSFLNVKGSKTINELQRLAIEESRLKIPLIIGDDVIHGLKTAFPIPLAEACSWDLDLIERTAAAAADEAKEMGVRWTFAPMVDVSREPRWGRVMEGAGEDAWLGGQIAAARVRGFQHIDENDGYPTVAACAKHYAGYGFSEAGREYYGTEISEQTMREYVLPPFKAAVDAGVATLMSGFHDINGVPASGNRHLLTEVLREEWGFNGFVVSDFNSVAELYNHGFAATKEEAAKRGFIAGVDMDMNSEVYLDHMKNLVETEQVPMHILDESVRRILTVKMWLGLFENPYVSGIEHTYERSPENLALAREAVTKSCVLLKNDGVLPLDLQKNKKLALIGPMATTDWGLIGTWHNISRDEDVVPIANGLKAQLPEDVELTVVEGCPIKHLATLSADDDKTVNTPNEQGTEAAVRAAQNADIAIVCVGESMDYSGENNSRQAIGVLPHMQTLLEAVCATGTPVVLVLSGGRSMELTWQVEHTNAILDIWMPGAEAGNGVADLLLGKANPSGRLVNTFPRSIGQVPIYYNYHRGGRSTMSRCLDGELSPLFPFGYGLSYTTFDYDNLQLVYKGREIQTPFDSQTLSCTECVSDVRSRSNIDYEMYYNYCFDHTGDIGKNQINDLHFVANMNIQYKDITTTKSGNESSLVLSVNVKNSGKRKGTETVQMYVSDIAGTLTRPVRELKAFRQVELEPGETKTISFKIGVEELGYMLGKNYLLEKGAFVLSVGTDSNNLLSVGINVE